MRFHLAPLSLTLSDLDGSIQVTQVFNGLYLQVVTIDDALEVIYEVSFGAIVFDLE